MAKRPCRGCTEKQAIIDQLIAGLSVRAAVPGPTLMEQAAEIAESESEEAQAERTKMAKAHSDYRNAFAKVHYRDPYADCVVK